MLSIPLLLVAIVVLALVFDYTNGAHDIANAISTVISTRVMSPRNAIIMAACLDFVGAFLGTNVAATIGKGIVHAEHVASCQSLVLATLVGAILWNLLTWWLALPSSSSHALVGGLIGAGVVYGGFAIIRFDIIVKKVLLPLVLCPLLGFLVAYLSMVALAWASRRAHPRSANRVFRGLQLVSAGLMALSHGANDAQKTMGIVTLALYTFHQIPALDVPTWVKIVCAAAISIGAATGGMRIIKTMGHKIFKMEPIHGFAAQTSAAGMIFAASVVGAPVSTTQVISSSVLGAGASRRFTAVRWGVARKMVVSWVLTIPAAALVGGACLAALRVLGL